MTGVTQDTLSCGVTLNFFCQCPPCIVTVLPRALCLSVSHSNCVFLSVSALHRDSVNKGSLLFGVTLKLCFFVSVRVAS